MVPFIHLFTLIGLEAFGVLCSDFLRQSNAMCQAIDRTRDEKMLKRFDDGYKSFKRLVVLDLINIWVLIPRCKNPQLTSLIQHSAVSGFDQIHRSTDPLIH